MGLGLGLVRLYRKLGGGGDRGWQCQGLERLKRWRKHWRPRTGKDRGSHRPCPPPGPSPLVNSDFKSTSQPQRQREREGHVPLSCARHLPFALLVPLFPLLHIHTCCRRPGVGVGGERLFFPGSGTVSSTYLQAESTYWQLPGPRECHPLFISLEQVLAASEALARHIRADCMPRSFRYSSSGMGPPKFYFQQASRLLLKC